MHSHVTNTLHTRITKYRNKDKLWHEGYDTLFKKKICPTLITLTSTHMIMAFLLGINIAVFLYTEMFQ